MAKLPTIKKLSGEDFPNVPKKLLDVLNQVFEPFFNAINGNLNFKENISGQKITVTINKGTTVSPTIPLKFAWSKPSPPTAVWIGNIQRKDFTNTGATAAIGIEWFYDASAKQVNITKLFGITTPDATYTYYLTLVGVTD